MHRTRNMYTVLVQCMHVLLYSENIRRHALMLLHLPKFKAELINANRPNSKTGILIGYWLAQQLIAVCDVQVTCSTCTGWTLTFARTVYNVCMHALLCGIKWSQS